MSGQAVVLPANAAYCTPFVAWHPAMAPGTAFPYYVPAPVGVQQLRSPPPPAQVVSHDSKGPIALLQEFIQAHSHVRIPQKRTILQWEYDTRMEDNATLQFSACVAFLHNGVPHYVAGQWLNSKKNAQRQAAESALRFLVANRGVEVNKVAGAVQDSHVAERDSAGREVRLLHAVYPLLPGCHGEPKWDVIREQDGSCRAVVELCVDGVVHKLAGGAQGDDAAAKLDAARRVLWYLQVPGFEDLFEPNPSAPSVSAKVIPAPPTGWIGDEEEEQDAAHTAERKTAIMRVQNRLQQLLAKRLLNGQPVWEWEYEVDPDDTTWPRLCRATARVAIIGKTFTGGWATGQRAAQVDTADQVAAYLDSANLGEGL